MNKHVFVVMPYGIKEDINFNKVYEEIIKPALEKESFEVFRADKEACAGNIRTDMFQELLLADLIVADLSIDNPNVWYELGVRHALRARGVILIQSEREHQPFDVYTDRKLHYHLKDGVPDPAYLDKDKTSLSVMARETMASWKGKIHSPVYHHLRYLKEPDWKTLRIDDAKEFWENYEKWHSYVKVAQNKNQPGNIITLAEETPLNILQLETYRCAGNSLMKLGQFFFAMEQFEKALTIDPKDLESLQKKGILLGRLKKYHEARVHLEGLLKQFPQNAEINALLGRVEKDTWMNIWKQKGLTVEEMQDEAAYEDGILQEAIEAYSRGFIQNPTNYFSGINAVALMHILKHLTGKENKKGLRQAMEGGIRWMIQGALARETPENKNYWARVTLGDLEVLSSDIETVKEAYKQAMAVVGNNWFALDSSRQQLLLLNDLGFRPEGVKAALKIFDRKLKNIQLPWNPRKVFLFSGHMIDAPNRPEPRFPPSMEQNASNAIAEKLDILGADHRDLALCGGACGGDLLFAEACLKRGMRLEVRIPFQEPEFLDKSVSFAGEDWRNRFLTMKNNPNTKLFVMPNELGPLPKKSNPYERNNIWQLYSALTWEPEKLNFICLWNRKGGDGRGGTKHLYETVKARSGHDNVIDISKLI